MITLFKKQSYIFLVLMIAIAACSKPKEENKPVAKSHEKSIPPWFNTTPKNPIPFYIPPVFPGNPTIPASPTPTPVAASPVRTLVRHLVLDSAFMERQDKLEYFGSLHPSSVCADWVKIEQNGTSVEVIELINSVNNCNTDSASVMPENEVFKRLNFFKASDGFYRIYVEDKTKFVGDMHEQRSSDGKTLQSVIIADLCTGTYYYEEPNGTCIVTANDQGQFEEFYY